MRQRDAEHALRGWSPSSGGQLPVPPALRGQAAQTWSVSTVRRTGRSSYQNRVASTSRSLSRKPRRKLSMKAVIIAGIILCGGFGL